MYQKMTYFQGFQPLRLRFAQLYYSSAGFQNPAFCDFKNPLHSNYEPDLEKIIWPVINIFLGGGCVIHYATRAYSLVSIRISIFSGCSIPRLGGGCSILLSYGDVCLIILSKNNPIVKWESKSETRRI